jgi:hypothetical protein
LYVILAVQCNISYFNCVDELCDSNPKCCGEEEIDFWLSHPNGSALARSLPLHGRKKVKIARSNNQSWSFFCHASSLDEMREMVAEKNESAGCRRWVRATFPVSQPASQPAGSRQSRKKTICALVCENDSSLRRCAGI